MEEPEILACMELDDALMHRLEDHFRVHKLCRANDENRFLDEVKRSVEALFTPNLHGADRALMEELPNLKIITVFGSGYDRIDVAAARAASRLLMLLGQRPMRWPIWQWAYCLPAPGIFQALTASCVTGNGQANGFTT